MGKEDQSHTANQQHGERSADAGQITSIQTSIQEEQAAVRNTLRGETHHEEQADLMALTDAQRPTQQVSEREYPTKSGKESPFLSVLMERGIAVSVARELLQVTAELSEKAEKYDRYRQKTKDSYQRKKEADPEGLKSKQREWKRNQRTRQKQETSPQEVQKS